MSTFTAGPWNIILGRNNIAIEDSCQRELATTWADTEIPIVEAQVNAN